MAAKERIDKILVARGLAETRERAQALVMAGRVFVKGQRVDKAGTPIALDAPVEVQGDAIPFVSRGGLKLDGVLDPLGVTVAGKVCLDVGASTGGFTDVLLQRGAVKVWAIDVGHGQLHEKIANDPRVVAHEGVNAKLGLAEVVTEKVALVVIDVSFISLTKILAAVVERLDDGGDIVAMVKPQFELSPKEVKGGVVREDALRMKAVALVVECAVALGLREMGREESPVHGPAGNREVFVRFSRA